MLNRVILQGRIPFDYDLKGGGDSRKSFVKFPLSVKRNFKKEGQQYADDDIIQCKAFGDLAEHIAKFHPKGSHLIVEGELRVEEDWVNQEGENVKGGVIVLVSPKGTYFTNDSTPKDRNNAKTESTSSNETKAEAPKGNPFKSNKAGSKKSII